MIKADGSPMGPLLRAINTIAKSLAQKFPNIAVDTLAYQYTQQPPTSGLRPEPNVIIRLVKHLQWPMILPLSCARLDFSRLTLRVFSVRHLEQQRSLAHRSVERCIFPGHQRLVQTDVSNLDLELRC